MNSYGTLLIDLFPKQGSSTAAAVSDMPKQLWSRVRKAHLSIHPGEYLPMYYGRNSRLHIEPDAHRAGSRLDVRLVRWCRRDDRLYSDLGGGQEWRKMAEETSCSSLVMRCRTAKSYGGAQTNLLTYAYDDRYSSSEYIE